MIDTDLLKKVRKIEIKTKGLSKHLFSGEYHSAFKGRGMAFSEVREYQFGDDIRNIDWNVTARLNHPYVKVFEEERELTVMLLVDVSGSNQFGTSVQFKEELLAEIAAILAFSAIQNNDKVGVIFFSDKIEKFISPKKGSTHILRIIRELIDFKPDNVETNITEALRYFTNVIKKKSTAFLISDFYDKNYEDALKIASKKHDIVAIRITDEKEKKVFAITINELRAVVEEIQELNRISIDIAKSNLKIANTILQQQPADETGVYTSTGSNAKWSSSSFEEKI